MEVINEAVTYLNARPEEVIAISSIIAVLVQYAINHVAGLGKLTNRLLGIVGLPGLLGLLAVTTTAFPPKYAPLIAVLGQILHGVTEKVIASFQSPASVEAPTFLDEPVTPQVTAGEY
jgi:hypothetical protein